MWKAPRGRPRKYLTEEERRAGARESARRSRERLRAADPEGYKRKGREGSRRWRERHPGQASKNVIAWRSRLQNRDELNAYRREWRRKNIIRVLWKEAKGRAKTRGIEFSIEFEDIPPMGEKCPIFRVPFSSPEAGRSPYSPSLDRIDPTKGYVKGNVWIVTYRANLIKNDGSLEEHQMIADSMRKALGLSEKSDAPAGCVGCAP